MKQDLINQITEAVQSINGVRFASLTYLTKTAGELSRYTVNLGFSYHNLVVKSVAELETLMVENKDTWTPLQKQAAGEVLASLNKTLAAHEVGEQNADYTKKDTYVSLGNGISLNTVDNSIQLFGLVQSKTVLVKGTYKVVKSAPLTIAKKEITRMLSLSKFREFAIDLNNVATVKVNGETLEMNPPVFATV